MGRKSKAEKGKMKIKLVESKIKIKEIGEEETLEQELSEEGREQFGEFMETGEMRAPVLETGQGEQGGRGVESAVSGERTAEGARAGREAGATVSPEFSMYEIARGLGRREATGETTRYTATRGAGDAVMQKRIPRPTTDEMQSNLANTKERFENPELERLRAGDDRGGKYYEAAFRGEEAKSKRKMPWEA